MATKYLKQSGGDVVEVVTVSTSSGSGDQDKIPSLDSSGKLDASFIPSGGGSSSFTLYTGLNNDTAVTTSQSTLFTASLPTAGLYRVKLVVRFRSTSGTGFNTITLSVAHGSLLETYGSWSRSRRNQTVDTGAAYGGPTLVSSRGAAIGDVHAIEFHGHVVVSASGSLTLKAQLDAGSGYALPGSYAQVYPETTSTTTYGYSNIISITSGNGYAGSTYTSSSAGQWKADGTNISGETGSTYTMSRANEGKAITCGSSSNTIQMWTPLHLPDVFKTDGSHYGGWWDPGDSASVTLNSGNVASLANQFSGGDAMVQSNGSLQVPLTSGFLAFPNSGQSGGYGLLSSSSSVVRRYVAAVVEYGAGTETTFGGYSVISGADDGGAGSHRLQGASGGALLFQNDNGSTQPDFGRARLNGGEDLLPNILPLPLSVVDTETNDSVPRKFGPAGLISNFNWRGRMGEFIYLAAAPSEILRYRIQGYLAWHNGIQAKLPPDHPHSSAPPRVS